MARTDLGQETPRNFTLFDAIVSVAAVGLALAFARTHLAYAWANLVRSPSVDRPDGRASGRSCGRGPT